MKFYSCSAQKRFHVHFGILFGEQQQQQQLCFCLFFILPALSMPAKYPVEYQTCRAIAIVTYSLENIVIHIAFIALKRNTLYSKSFGLSEIKLIKGKQRRKRFPHERRVCYEQVRIEGYFLQVTFHRSQVQVTIYSIAK